MAPLPLRSSRSVPVVKSSPPKRFHFFCLASVFVVCSTLSALAAAPPSGENAYCGKGNVAQFGAKDGVAELPKACYYTALDGTPSPGKQIRVSAKSDLAAAIDGAKCGDTLLLPSGASFDVNELPSKKCDDQHYITVRTDTPDSKLPPEGTRISPAWAGVASLPGRPPFAQPSNGTARLLATLVVRRVSGAIVGDHVRFIGIEWTTPPDADIGRIVTAEHSDHVIFDRNWVHPADGREVGHGIGIIHGSHMIAVINSYISGLNCIARTGKCTDATAVGGGSGDDPISALKVYNNFLESAGENILFGGSAAKQVPTDIEIRRNHLFRPMLWKEGQPGYTPTTSGDPYIVKNNCEFKNAIRVLFEANLLENTWGGFSQTGYSILITPKNQSSECPICRVNDVTIRFDRIRNVAGVLQIANALAKTGAAAADGGRYSIHDIFADDLHDRDYKGGGSFLILISAQPPVHDIQIDHVTAFVSGVLLSILNSGAKLTNFTLTNSVFSVGDRRPPVASAGGGPESCASKNQGLGSEAVLQACFDPYKFDRNLIISGRGSFPKGNIVVGSPQAAGIRDLKDVIAKDPRLCHAKGPGCAKASPGAGAASDGGDLGADIDAVEAAIAGVE
ncbi:MAG TPA: hypothetical protein VJX30_01190 [Terriglobales bacterium]|nr:hypothetical protein [Terriglobales bacterium]